MKKSLLIISALFTLVSCSGIGVQREPSSDNTCGDFVKKFFAEDVKADKSKLTALVEKKILKEADLAFLKEKEIQAFLTKQKSERAEIEADLLLIKKKYQHMDSSQVIGHFKLLRNSCQRG